MKRETIHFIRLCMKITCSHPPLLISIKFVWQSIYKSKRMIDYFVVAFIKLFNTTIQYVQNVYQSFFWFSLLILQLLRPDVSHWQVKASKRPSKQTTLVYADQKKRDKEKRIVAQRFACTTMIDSDYKSL